MSTWTESPSVARRLARWASRIAFALACAAVLGIVLVLTVLPRLTGGAALNVLTGSMTPGIPVGSVVLIRPVDPQTLHVGDIATYQISPDSPALVTHRIIEISGAGDGLRFTFKGDANRGPDSSPVPPQAIRGQVWFHVPLLGSLRDAVHGVNIVILLAPPALGAYALFLVFGGVRDRRKSRMAAGRGSVPSELIVDRPIVEARLRLPSSMPPAELARSWGGLVLSSDDAQVHLLIAPPTQGLAATLELLQGHDPVEVRVWDGVVALTGEAVTIRTAADSEEESHVVG